jgi:hypothetical protein
LHESPELLGGNHPEKVGRPRVDCQRTGKLIVVVRAKRLSLIRERHDRVSPLVRYRPQENVFARMNTKVYRDF